MKKEEFIELIKEGAQDIPDFRVGIDAFRKGDKKLSEADDITLPELKELDPILGEKIEKILDALIEAADYIESVADPEKS